MYAPGMRYNLLSACKLRRDAQFAYNDDTFALHDRKSKEKVGSVFFHLGVPFLVHKDSGLQPIQVAMASISAELAHRRLGHAGYPKRKAIEKDLGIEINDDNHSFHCVVCKLGKSKKIISWTPQTRATRPG
ncbi:hypothetical protein N7540_000130 [Penicillium herquei]|nr:hypothetical protein N7540_000130 [Penicillium herquei]